MKTKSQFWKDLKSGQFVSLVKESSRGKRLCNSQEVFHIMKPVFAEAPDVETMYGIFMNSKNNITAMEKLFSGSIASTVIYPRELIKIILARKAAAIVLVHNHPSLDPTPSVEDRVLTGKLIVALRSIDAQLHDHIIIGDGYYSFADAGFMDTMARQLAAFYRTINNP